MHMEQCRRVRLNSVFLDRVGLAGTNWLPHKIVCTAPWLAMSSEYIHFNRRVGVYNVFQNAFQILWRGWEGLRTMTNEPNQRAFALTYETQTKRMAGHPCDNRCSADLAQTVSDFVGLLSPKSSDFHSCFHTGFLVYLARGIVHPVSNLVVRSKICCWVGGRELIK